MSQRICSYEECTRPHLARGYCNVHYKRLSLYGSPAKTGRGTPQERFWSKVEKTDTCWNWTGHLDAYGHGRFWLDGKNPPAHRTAYIWQYGPVPSTKFIDHRCRNAACVRPTHLRVVTPKQNSEHRAGAMKNSKSGILGVSWAAEKDRWRAVVRHAGKDYSAGYHRTVEEAEAAVVAKRLELFTHNDVDRVMPNLPPGRGSNAA